MRPSEGEREREGENKRAAFHSSLMVEKENLPRSLLLHFESASPCSNQQVGELPLIPRGVYLIVFFKIVLFSSSSIACRKEKAIVRGSFDILSHIQRSDQKVLAR